jgi:alpha-L-rhamnosidase
LTWVNCSYDSVHGRITSRWKRDGNRLTLEASIPANTTATVFVPTKKPRDVREGAAPARRSSNVKLLRYDATGAVFRIGSGRYVFTSDL